MTKIEKEALAYLETLANFGGTIQQARELAQKGVDKLSSLVDEDLDEFYYKMGCFIDHATGGRLSKPEWSLEVLKSAHDESVQYIVEDCINDYKENS